MNPHAVIFDDPPAGIAAAEPILAGLVYPRQVVAIRGFSASARADLAIGLAHAYATGRGEFHGRKMASGSVLVIEGGQVMFAKQIAAAAELNGHARTKLGRLRIAGALDADTVRTANAAMSRFDQRPKLVVVGAFATPEAIGSLLLQTSGVVILPNADGRLHWDVELIAPAEGGGPIKYTIRNGDKSGTV